jgi:hypothetical protein
MINIRNRGKHRSLEEWRSILEDWRLSGLSQVEYCKQHSISKSVFYKYHKRLKFPITEVAPEVNRSTVGKSKFIEASIKHPLIESKERKYFSLRISVLNCVFLLELNREANAATSL